MHPTCFPPPASPRGWTPELMGLIRKSLQRDTTREGACALEKELTKNGDSDSVSIRQSRRRESRVSRLLGIKDQKEWARAPGVRFPSEADCNEEGELGGWHPCPLTLRKWDPVECLALDIRLIRMQGAVWCKLHSTNSTNSNNAPLSCQWTPLK